MAETSPWKRGQKVISANNQNRTRQNAGSASKISFSSDFQGIQNSLTGPAVALNRRRERSFFNINGGAGIVVVSSGPVEWNGKWLNTSGTTLSGLTSNSARYAIMISASNTSGNRDPMLNPNKVTVFARNTTGSSQKEQGGTDGWYKDKYAILGYVYTNQNGKIRKISQGDGLPINRRVNVLDSSTNYPSETPVRSTIGHNDAATVHRGETELYNVDSVPASEYRIPFFPADSNGSGELTWGAPDSDWGGAASGTQRSLERRVSASGSYFQWYNFDSNVTAQAVAGDWVPFKDVSTSYLEKMNRDQFSTWVLGSSVWSSTSILEHEKLQYTLTSSGIGSSNRNHSYVHPLLGSSFNYVAFRSIGFAKGFRTNAGDFAVAAVDRIQLENGNLVGTAWKTTNTSDIKDGVLGTASLGSSGGFWVKKRMIIGSSATSTGSVNTGAWQNRGGGSFRRTLYGEYREVILTLLDTSSQALRATNTTHGTDCLLGTEGWGLDVADGDARVSSAHVYYHGANSGAAITNWFSGGIFYGSSVIEISGDDLRASDKILVIR